MPKNADPHTVPRLSFGQSPKRRVQRRAFLSFHFDGEAHQARLFQDMKAIRVNRIAEQSEWEKIRKRGDDAILRWINLNMRGRSVVIVLIGRETANRKWVLYEIQKGWQSGKGVLGIHVHNLHKPGILEQGTMQEGDNPFNRFSLKGKPFSEIAQAHRVPNHDREAGYQLIEESLWDWIERAIAIRSRYPGWQMPIHT